MLKMKNFKLSKISSLDKNKKIGDVLLKIFALLFAIMLVFMGKIRITNGISSNNKQAIFRSLSQSLPLNRCHLTIHRKER